MEQSRSTASQIFARIPEGVHPDAARELSAVVQFNLSGDQGGKWWVQIHDGTATSGRGNASNSPDVTVIGPAGDFVAACLEVVDQPGDTGFGKCTVKGDAGVAGRVRRLISSSI